MAVIRRLPDHLVNQIAAGEVIERPAAALKELVENSIDAEATHIAVTYRDGGRSYLSVDDNGIGMTAEEIALAVERHATSKLPSDRLDQINTMGFRGEALPSIGAVSRLSITSRVRNDTHGHGWRLTVEGGAKSAAEPAARAHGTLVEIRDLFYATPARLKFLKAQRTEAGHIADALDRLALAFPHIGFSLQDDTRAVLNYPARQSADERIADIMGNDFVDNAIAVDAARDTMRLAGWAGLPTQHKATAAAQYFYVNNRAVKDKILSNAIRAAYHDVVPSGRYAALVLYLDIHPELIDVNVHPAKTEVRFQDAGSVREFVVNALRQALGGHRVALPSPSMSWMRPALPQYSAPDAIAFAGTFQAPSNNYRPGYVPAAPAVQNHFQFAPSVRTAEEPAPEPDSNHFLGTALLQMHDNYILARAAAGLVIVDQHAAHERLVYEKIKAGMEGKSIERQGLLIPAVIDLPRRERDALIARQEELDQMGLSLESFGQGAILIREIPAMLGKIDIGQMIKDLATEILTYDTAMPLQEKLYQICATMACYNSVRSGRRLNTDEMNALLRQIEQTPNAQTCNHGRPTYFVMTETDMEKLFKRR